MHEPKSSPGHGTKWHMLVGSACGRRHKTRNMPVKPPIPGSIPVLVPILVAILMPVLLTACDRPASPADSAADPGPPPGFDQLEPAVRNQFHDMRERLSRARAASAAGPAVGRIWGELGKWFHVYRFPDSAMRCYREAARLDAGEPRWSYYLGLLAVEAGELNLAAVAFEAAARLAPASKAAPMQLAELMLKQGQTARAEDYYRQVLQIKPEDLAASIGLARLYLQRHNAGRALELLQPRLEPDGPAAAELHYLAAQAYRLLGDAGRARRYLDLLPDDHGDETPLGARDPWLDELMAMNISSNHLTRLAMGAYRRGNFRLATSHSGRAVALNPDNPELRANYAAALLGLGRARAALVQLDVALQYEPDLARAHLVRGSSYLRLGDRAAARDALLQAVALDGGLKDARRQLGRIYQQLGQTELAIEQYAELRARYREVHQVRFWHSALLAAIGRNEQALAALDEDLEVHPGSALLKLLRIRILATAPDQAVRNPTLASSLLAGLATSKSDVYYAESAAMVAAALGYHAQAADWQLRAVEALERLPDGGPARIARRRLTLYREQKACRTPWEPGESLITRPVEPPAELAAGMDNRY